MHTPRPESVIRILTLVAAAVALSSCVTYEYDLREVAVGMRERKRSLPEQEWNAEGIWRRVADAPATYIPSDYPAAAPRTPSEGEWLTDERDGKRFFVPAGGVSGLSEAVLRKDAIKNSTPFRATPKKTYLTPTFVMTGTAGGTATG